MKRRCADGQCVCSGCLCISYAFENETGADIVAAAYKKAADGEAEIYINRVNLLEAYYGFYRDDGKDFADSILAGVEQSVVMVTDFDESLLLEAGRLKASYKISLADAIALSQTLKMNGELLTSDHHEFDALDGVEPIKFHWTR